MGEWLDLEDKISASMVTDAMDRFVGLKLQHPCLTDYTPDGEIFIPFDKTWNRADPKLAGVHLFELGSWEPIEIREIIGCPRCSLSGSIRGGRWIDEARRI